MSAHENLMELRQLLAVSALHLPLYRHQEGCGPRMAACLQSSQGWQIAVGTGGPGE